MSKTASLTPKQQRWVDEYLLDLNATQAAIRAGYSKHTAKQMGAENLSKPVVRAQVDAALAAMQQHGKLTKDRLVRDLDGLFGEALRQKHFHGASRLGELLARLHGYIVETRNVRMIRSISDLSDEELQALAAGEGSGEEVRH